MSNFMNHQCAEATGALFCVENGWLLKDHIFQNLGMYAMNQSSTFGSSFVHKKCNGSFLVLKKFHFLQREFFKNDGGNPNVKESTARAMEQIKRLDG
jgi:hypothetical protein